MTRDEAVEQAIAALTQLQRTCAEYMDMTTAQIAAESQTRLVRRRSDVQVMKMEQERGIGPARYGCKSHT